MRLSPGGSSILVKPSAGLIFALLNSSNSECECERDAEKTRDDSESESTHSLPGG